MALYHDLVFNLLVPNWNVFGPLVGLAEVTAGLLLLLGLASWIGALLAALLSLHIQFSDATGPWLYEYAVEWVPLLCLVFMRACVGWGLDGRIAQDHPRWRWFFAQRIAGVKIGRAGSAWPAVILLALAACGSRQPALSAGSASRAAPSVAATPVATATSLPPSPALPEVPDFPVVAYQGDEVFGGHDGHFRPVFAAGRPVVLLFFAGL